MPTKKRVSNRSLSEMPAKFPEVGERLEELKKALGITYQDMASDLGRGITPQTLANIARGASNMSIHVMRALKAEYKISYDFLIDGKDKPKIQKKESADDRVNRILSTIESAIKKANK